MPGLAADLVVRNANIITVDQQQPRAQALAIRGGKFVAIGKNDGTVDLVGARTEVLDLRGKTVVPGFIDAHMHSLATGIQIELIPHGSGGSCLDVFQLVPGNWDAANSSNSRIFDPPDPIRCIPQDASIAYVDSLRKVTHFLAEK